jgi:hypothetical protein
MFQLHQERDGFIRFAGERDYRLGEDVQCCGNSGILQMWLRLRLHSLGHCDVICVAMGREQATISLDGCVLVVRFFNRAIITRFYYYLGYSWVSFLSMYRYCVYPCCGTLLYLLIFTLLLSNSDYFSGSQA